MYATQGMHIPVVDAQLRYRNTISYRTNLTVSTVSILPESANA